MARRRGRGRRAQLTLGPLNGAARLLKAAVQMCLIWFPRPARISAAAAARGSRSLVAAVPHLSPIGRSARHSGRPGARLRPRGQLVPSWKCCAGADVALGGGKRAERGPGPRCGSCARSPCYALSFRQLDWFQQDDFNLFLG